VIVRAGALGADGNAGTLTGDTTRWHPASAHSSMATTGGRSRRVMIHWTMPPRRPASLTLVAASQLERSVAKIRPVILSRSHADRSLPRSVRSHSRPARLCSSSFGAPNALMHHLA
jgi:hypothetical protein